MKGTVANKIIFFSTDSPILLSFPHFYMGDDRIRTAVDGISPPEASKHEFYLDVQPVSTHTLHICSSSIRNKKLYQQRNSSFFQEMGVALRAKARFQVNLAVSQVVDIKQVATFPDIIFPIMWFEDVSIVWVKILFNLRHHHPYEHKYDVTTVCSSNAW